MSDSLTLVAAGLLGAIVGSFLNVVIHRMPERDDQRARGPRSACPRCGAPIPAMLNIPVVSWLLLRGRARCCGARISVRYPLVEAMTAVLFVALVWRPPSGYPVTLVELTLVGGLAFALHAYFVGNLVAQAFIDLEFRILPDKLTKPLMVFGVAGALVLGLVRPRVGDDPSSFLILGASSGSDPLGPTLLASLLGLGAGIALTWAVRAGGRVVFRKEAMGLGDVKLMGGVGAFLGWQGAILTFFLGCVFGALTGGVRAMFTRDPYVAFGPFLVLGALVALFFERELIEFLTVTWPGWQTREPSAAMAVLGTGLLLSVVLLFLVRRGRST